MAAMYPRRGTSASARVGAMYRYMGALDAGCARMDAFGCAFAFGALHAVRFALLGDPAALGFKNIVRATAVAWPAALAAVAFAA